MENAAHKLADQLHAKVIGHVNLPEQTLSPPFEQTGEAGRDAGKTLPGDAFLFGISEGVGRPAGLGRELVRAISEINELQSENRWADIVSLFWPIEEKLSEFCAAGLDDDLRLKVSFALCRTGKNEEAIDCLLPVVAKKNENYLAHYNIGYAVLDHFYRARTERRIIPVKKRAELLKLAHYHFDRARTVKPDSVTFCYRHAILCKEIEDKPKLAVPLFQQG